MRKTIYQAITITIFLFILLGVVYPLLITVVGRWIFPSQANGSMLSVNGVPVGSKLIGQNFVQAKYFHGRPSSAGNGYDAANSSPSNLAPTNKALYDKMDASIQQVLKENPTLKVKDIPIDLVTGSGSGLDPDISPESAYVQISRVALARKIDENRIKLLVEQNIHEPTFGFIGERTVNVLMLNVALDSISLSSTAQLSSPGLTGGSIQGK